MATLVINHWISFSLHKLVDQLEQGAVLDHVFYLGGGSNELFEGGFILVGRHERLFALGQFFQVPVASLEVEPTIGVAMLTNVLDHIFQGALDSLEEISLLDFPHLLDVVLEVLLYLVFSSLRAPFLVLWASVHHRIVEKVITKAYEHVLWSNRL